MSVLKYNAEGITKGSLVRAFVSIGRAFLAALVFVTTSASAGNFISSGKGSGAVRAEVVADALTTDANLTLRIGAQTFVLVRDRIVTRAGITFWDGHVEGMPNHKLAFQLRDGALTGVLDLPGRPLRLGLVNGVQWLVDTPADEIRAELPKPLLFVARTPAIVDAAAPAAASGPLAKRPPGSDADDVPPAAVAYPVEFNLAALSLVQPGQQVALELGDTNFDVVYEETRVSADGHSTWVGYLSQYGQDYRVFLNYAVDGATTGSITAPSGEFLVTGKAGQTWVINTTASGIRHNPTAKEGDELDPPAAAGTSAKGGTRAATATTSSTTTSSTAATASTSANTTLDILVLYTPGLVTRYGGESGAANRIEYFVALANKAYADSGVPITLRTVGRQLLNIADATSNSTALSDLTANRGSFAGVGTLRNSLGADGVLLLRPFYMSGQGGNCGVAWVGGANGTPMSGYANYAYAVVSEGTDVAKSGYYCTDYTFAHELGHNLGLKHDRATNTAQGGGTGALPYAFGYGRQGVFGTVMSYYFPVLGKFSNPLDSTCSNGPCGVAETDTANSANNAKALGITRTPFAAYRSTVVAATVSVAGIVTVDGKAAANLVVSVNGATCATTATTGAYACKLNAGFTGTISVAAANVTFSPPSASFTNLQASVSQNFAGVSTKQPVTISGRVIIDRRPAMGQAVYVDAKACTTTATSDAYSCTVPYGWSGTLSVSSSSAIFSPVSIKSLTANKTLSLLGVSKPVPVQISGLVRVNGVARAGVAIQATGASCTSTNAQGMYSCTLMTHGTGSVLPTLGGVTFYPASVAFSNILDPLTANFSGK